MNNTDYINCTVQELATRLANVEIDRAKFLAYNVELKKENQELQNQIDAFKNQPQPTTNDNENKPGLQNN